ncbi:MAG TPA: carboxy terminal-processing peptidase [Steroidobacteraceae bacterium]|nr:carboxy terminal-processing peptidase [Steroidobacteraceae bacterium]
MQTTHRLSAGFTASAIIAVMLALVSSSQAPASTSALPPGAIAPGERHRLVARRVGMILEDTHYRRAGIDDRMSSQIFDRYLQFLDGQRSYFLASDIAEFERYRMRFDDMIRTGEIEPAYVIFARYQARNRDRVQHALVQLAKEPDWTIDESFGFDRSEAAWPATEAEMNEIWRKRVKNDALGLMLAGKTWEEAADTLRKRYERVQKRVDQVTAEDVFENLMNAYARTFDPHSSYFSPRNSEEYRIQMSLNYEGIGASLQLIDEFVTVMNVIEGGPAAVAGTLKPTDRIVGVAQGADGAFTDVVGWRIDDVVQLIRGKGGTLVRLRVLPGGAAPGTPERTLEFTRNKVTLEAQAAKKSVHTLARGGHTYRIGVINVPGFYQDIAAQNAGDDDYRSTTRDVRRLIAELQDEGIDGLVMDLRGNGGGYLPEATALTGLFIDRGPVVQLRDSGGRTEVLDDPEPGVVYGGPLAVLVDRFSASASEIFAGAIQDYRRGVVLGQQTFGKGTVQNLVPLDGYARKPVNGQLTVTIGKFYRITGESTQLRGVSPDVPLASLVSVEDVGESALDEALPWDRIAGVPYRSAAGSGFTPATLADEEGARAAVDPNYRWLVADIAAIKEIRDQTAVSLNLAKRQEERAALERDRLARENTRRATLGQAPLAALDDADPDDTPDIVLNQATEVMADMVGGHDRKLAPKTVSRTP